MCMSSDFEGDQPYFMLNIFAPNYHILSWKVDGIVWLIINDLHYVLGLLVLKETDVLVCNYVVFTGGGGGLWLEQ